MLAKHILKYNILMKLSGCTNQQIIIGLMKHGVCMLHLPARKVRSISIILIHLCSVWCYSKPGLKCKYVFFWLSAAIINTHFLNQIIFSVSPKAIERAGDSETFIFFLFVPTCEGNHHYQLKILNQKIKNTTMLI